MVIRKIKYIETDPLLERIQEAAKKTNRWVDPVRHFRASGLKQTQECAKATVFDRMGHRELFNTRTLGIFAMGNAVEDKIIKQMKKAKVFWAEQIPVDIEYVSARVEGTLDCIIERDGEANLVEIKSMKSSVFERLPKSHDYLSAGQSPVKTQHLGYILQWNLYAAASGIHKGCLFIENKDTSEQICFWLTYDDDLLFDSMTS